MKEDMVIVVKADISEYDQSMKKVGEEPNKAARRASKGFNAMSKFLDRVRKRAEMLNKTKVSPVVRLIDRISGPVRKIESRLNGLSKKTVTVLVKAKDMVGGVINKLTSPLTLLGAGAGVTGGIIYPLKLAGEMNRYENAVVNFSKTAEEGKKNFQDLVDFAVKSPVYDVPFVAQMGGRLLGISKDLNFTKRSLEDFGNTMMYTGATLDDVKFAFRGYQQIAAKGVLQMEELYQVTENLNVPLSWVAEELGVTGDQLSDLGKLGIPAQRAMEAILRTLEKRFPKANFNEDLLALSQNLLETGRIIVWRFGDGMAKPVIKILQDMVGATDATGDGFKDFSDRVTRAGETVGKKLNEAYFKAKAFFREMTGSRAWQEADWGGKVGILLNGMTASMTNWLAGPGGEALASLGASMGRILFQAVEGAFMGAMMDHPILRTVAAGYAGGRVAGVPGAITGIAASTVAEAPIQAAKSNERIAEAQMQKIREVGDIFDDFKAHPEKYQIQGGTIENQKQSWWQKINPFKHAEGGTFTKPHFGVVAEAGPEAIIPLSSRMRNRALELWQQAGQYLGVRPYAEGGFAGMVPSVASTGGLNVNVSAPITVQGSEGDIDFDALALEIGWRIVGPIKHTLENKV